MELESGADSVSSTPRAAHHKLSTTDDKSVVRLMCSFGGKILPRPHDNQLRYVGGDTRIVATHRNTNFSGLVTKLSKLLVPNSGDFTIKYQLPNEDLDALITVSSDEDVENMMDEFERLSLQQHNDTNNISRVPRLRLFLFPITGIEDSSRASSINSLLDGSRKRENWFLDALNGGAAGAPPLERGRSEASSMVSEVPDYLFGLDNSDDMSAKLRNRVGLGDGVPGSDPGSPAFGSTSSATQMPNLPPVKTKPEDPNPVEDMGGVVGQLSGGYSAGGGGGLLWGHNSNPGSPSPAHAHTTVPVQTIPVYYVQAGPGQGLVPHRNNSHLQAVPVPGPFIQQYGPGQVQVPVGYPGSGPVHSGGPVRTAGGMMDPYEMQMQGNMVTGPGSSGLSHPLYYGVKNAGMVASHPGMVVQVAADEAAGFGSDPSKGRTLQP